MMWPPASSSSRRSRSGTSVTRIWLPAAESGVWVVLDVGAGWQASRQQMAAAIREARILVRGKVIACTLRHPKAKSQIQIRACKVLGIVLLNRVCGQVYWIRWTISSAGVGLTVRLAPTYFRADTGA